MVEINKDSLEKALDSKDKPMQETKPSTSSNQSDDSSKAPQMPREMEIGFHQGALNTLVKERNELVKIIMQVEQVMQAHIKRLEDLGVKIQKGPGKKS